MFNMIFENKNGEELHFGDGYPFVVTDFKGMNPPKATINTNEAALVDGGKFNSAKLQMRSVNIAFAIEEAAEANRLRVYKVVQSKMPLKIYYISDHLNVFLEGYVEEIDFSYWAKKNICTVSVLCPFPYFKAIDEVISDFTTSQRKFFFPFHSTANPKEIVFGEVYDYIAARVDNAGNVQTGLIFKLYASDNVVNPKITDRVTGEFFKINITMEEGDIITVNTNQGYKKVTLEHDDEIENIFNDWDDDSTWLQLDIGGNIYLYGADSGADNLTVEISHYDLFEGV